MKDLTTSQRALRRLRTAYDQFINAAKVEVNGDNAHPLFKYLKKQFDVFVTNGMKSNFTKFLIVNDEHLNRYVTKTSPLEI
ncbi:hypothetical protein PsorP6_000674 [Peronosclerospora sorghi]|uniref:Uncharacterized protein n=1 Tax=Peronosclerospora sorghi TaxID=230839 RepID=A0ACC0WU17_9STRA|nr:hypothetical protein PsorP6_000674 [Peronosclerospora sorghi]